MKTKTNKQTKKLISIETLYGRHRILMEPDEKKGFIVTAPDLPGVITWGKNTEHAKKMVKEAIELCIECEARKRIFSVKNKKSSYRIPENVSV